MKNHLFKSLLITTFLLLITGCTVEINENAKHEKTYELKAINDYSSGNSKNIRWFINAPEAITPEQRVYTALSAAKECKKKNEADECTVHQVATLNAFSYGDMFYTILTLDKNNQTNVTVADYKLSKQEHNIAYYYIKLRITYKDMPPEEFKKIFYDVMINKLKVPVEQLKLPQIERKEFVIK